MRDGSFECVVDLLKDNVLPGVGAVLSNFFFHTVTDIGVNGRVIRANMSPNIGWILGAY